MPTKCEARQQCHRPNCTQKKNYDFYSLCDERNEMLRKQRPMRRKGK